ncbi:MAG: YdcH family protein [Rhodobacteraceae bacterium]|nr:YdcH family protein [Paracoccaceae bacterium]MCY4249245.1 YdcH family protein [Paracoccaceae bacterium]MCY4308173.1 YdcH family protein [Paracoccaceae bacterium]
MAEMEYLEALKQKHKELSERVEQAEKSPSPDHIQIVEMKKQKLHLKEKIFGMS